MQSFGHYIPVSIFQSARPGSVPIEALSLWSGLEFLQRALRWRWTESLMQGLRPWGEVDCVALEDAEAGLCVWAAGWDVSAAEAGAGSFDRSAVIENVEAPVCTGPLA